MDLRLGQMRTAPTGTRSGVFAPQMADRWFASTCAWIWFARQFEELRKESRRGQRAIQGTHQADPRRKSKGNGGAMVCVERLSRELAEIRSRSLESSSGIKK